MEDPVQLNNPERDNPPFRAELVRCMPEVLRYARRLTDNPIVAEDMTQDCLLRALSRAHRFQLGTNMEAWLTTITRRLYLNQVVSKKSLSCVELGDEAASVPAPQLSRLMLRDADRAFRLLSDRQRKVVRTVAVNGSGYREAAEELDMATGTVRSCLSRARSQMAAHLEGASAKLSERPVTGRHCWPRPTSRRPSCSSRVPAHALRSASGGCK